MQPGGRPGIGHDLRADGVGGRKRVGWDNPRACAAISFAVSFLSLLLSVFNLLPTQPLDGGRLLAILWDNPRACAAISFAVSFLLLGCGLFLMAKGMGLGLLIAGIWLMIAQAAL